MPGLVFAVWDFVRNVPLARKRVQCGPQTSSKINIFVWFKDILLTFFNKMIFTRKIKVNFFFYFFNAALKILFWVSCGLFVFETPGVNEYTLMSLVRFTFIKCDDKYKTLKSKNIVTIDIVKIIKFLQFTNCVTA